MLPAMTRRLWWMAVLVSLPMVAAAVVVAGDEVYRHIDPGSPLFGEPPAASLADAITHGLGVEQAYVFIRAGQDPNAPVAVANEDYTGGRMMRVSPLILAIASRDGNVVQMLLNFGARLDLPQNRDAWCLATALRNDEAAGILARAGGTGSPACAAERPDRKTPPLLVWERMSR